MKRGLLFLGLALVFTMGLFAKGGAENAAPGAAGGVSKFKPDPATVYKVTLTAQNGPGVPLDANPEMVAYWNKKLNVDIKLVDIIGLGGDAGLQKLNLMISSGEVPDMFQTNAVNLQKYYETGALASIDDTAMKTYMPTVVKKLEQESNGTALRYGKFDGQRYGLVRGFWLWAQYRSNLIFRGDWLKKVGLPVPKTLDDYEKVFYAFAKNDPDGNGKQDTYGLSRTMVDQIYGAFGVIPGALPGGTGQWSEVGGAIACDDVQPGIKEALAYLAKWYKDGVLDPEFVTGENQGGYWALTHTFLNGRIGSTAMGSVYHWTPELPGRSAGADYLEAAKNGIYDSLVFANPPVGPGGKQACATEGELISNSFLVFGSQLKKDPAKMGKLFEMNEAMFNGDKDTFLTLFLGIKGKHWDYADNGFAKAKGGLVDRDMQKMGAWGALLSFQFINEGRLTDGSVMKWAEEHEYTVGVKGTKVPGFITTPARSQYQAELSKIRDQAYTDIITGKLPLSSFDEFVAKWKKSGGDELTKELNAWYAANK